jgi:hypothetical protein
LFAVTVTLAWRLAVSSHQAWPPVLISILLGMPTLYVAWLAVPGVMGVTKRPVHGRLTRSWDPVDLGVHQVIGGGPMPAYVRRPHDELLRAVLDPAVPASRLVVVRGGSSTGKTRAAYEAVVARLADWQLDYPLDPGALEERLETGVPARTVLWLGELRQYVDADGGPAVLARLADLLDDDGHLIITTSWPEHWTTYTAAARAGLGAADPAGTAGRLLKRLPELTDCDPTGIKPARGGVIDVPDGFTLADLKAATRTGDSVLAAAVAAAADAGQDGQVTQYLAGVPDLLDRYEGAGGDPYGRAILTAAMDATQLGHASPLPAALLQEAAVGYLTDPQRTKDIASWRDSAMEWATEELKGTVRALQPVPGGSGTGIAGYQVADYLIQYATRKRRSVFVPASTWDAILNHVGDPTDAARLAGNASDRKLYHYAIPLYRHAANAGDWPAAQNLVRLLAERGDLDELRARADAGDRYAAARLADLLAERGDLDELRARADAGDLFAGLRLADLLAERGELDELRARADAGDRNADARLADLLAERGDLDEAVQIMRALAGAGDRLAALRLEGLLAERGDLDELRARTDVGDRYAAEALDSPAELSRLSVPGGAEPIPDQLALPGMELPEPMARAEKDRELAAVEAELRGLDGDGSQMATAIRGALDMLLDGQHTGRYRWDQLHKTEKTHVGTLIEITLARSLRLADGATLDYTIAGADVDCTFSHRMGGWMIPPEADGKLMLLVQASDEDGTWSAGLLRADPEYLRPSRNRDGKRALSERGRAAVRWLHARAPLQENALIRLPEADVAAIFALPSGQQRVNELFRRAQRIRVSRAVVATVAMQDDYMKRVRGGGGARDQLRDEGIVIFGDYAGDQVLAAALGLPRPGPGEFVSARLTPLPRRADGGNYARAIRLAGTDWMLANADDQPGSAPALPR